MQDQKDPKLQKAGSINTNNYSQSEIDYTNQSDKRPLQPDNFLRSDKKNLTQAMSDKNQGPKQSSHSEYSPQGRLINQNSNFNDPSQPQFNHNHKFTDQPINPIMTQDIDIQVEDSEQQSNQQQHQNDDDDQLIIRESQTLSTDSQDWKSWYSEKKPVIGKSYNLFKIPKIRQQISDSTIIGVIDQSGSMGDCFQWLAKEWNSQIKANYQSSKEADQLQEDPEMGTTDVEAGFNLLNNTLATDDTLDYVTIIFVSDGQDNDQDTIFERLDRLVSQIPQGKKINFLTIGVGEGFPTYLAMQLRQMYHTGEENIPPVFLVYNQHIHDNWKVTFKIINKYLSHNDAIITDCKEIQKFPWVEPNEYVYENQWVYVKNPNVDKINVSGIEIEPVDKMSPQEVLQVLSTMLSSIQLGNLKNGQEEQTYQQAQVALSILENLKKKYWGRGRKKREEKEQLETIQSELKDLEKYPDMKNLNDIPEKEKDQHLALKLAVGALGAGVGLYWLSDNYGDFANIIGGMNFSGQECCGQCGPCDQVAQLMGCDNCGQCCGDILATGEDCFGEFCKCFYTIMESACTCICGILE